MPRRRYVWCPTDNALVEVSTNYCQPRAAPFVIPDTPDYVSPVSGLLVSGRKQRRDDLKRSGSRPWEGFQAEKRESLRQKAYNDQALDQKLEVAARRAYYEMPPERRRILEGQ